MWILGVPGLTVWRFMACLESSEPIKPQALFQSLTKPEEPFETLESTKAYVQTGLLHPKPP